MEKILIVKKMSSLEYYYNGSHKSKELQESHEENGNSIKKIEEILSDYDIRHDIVTREQLQNIKYDEYDSVISAGGDGTVIAVAAYNLNTPQLNLRTDSKSKGALCFHNVEKALESMLKGDFHIENWTRQDIYLDNKFIGRASNETCVGEKLRFDKLAKYKLLFLEAENGLTQQETQSGSGIIIVTGTGSSAWPAAFKPYSRDCQYFKFKTLLQHSGIIEQGKASSVKIDYKGHEGRFSIDTREYDLPRDSVLEIKQSKFPLRIINPNI
jgi:NAD kinase